MIRKKLKAIYIFGILILLIPNLVLAELDEPPATEEIATIYFAPDYGSFLSHDELIIDIIVNPANQATNLAYLDINFDQNLLSLETIDYSSSFCHFKILEIVDNQTGNLILACGTEKTDLATTSPIVRLTFFKLNTGIAKFSFNNTSLLISDGLGTEILTSNEVHYIEISK